MLHWLLVIVFVYRCVNWFCTGELTLFPKRASIRVQPQAGNTYEGVPKINDPRCLSIDVHIVDNCCLCKKIESLKETTDI